MTDSIAGIATTIAQQDFAQAHDIAVLSKVAQQQEQQGEAALKLIEAADDIAPRPTADGSGQHVDVYA